MASTSIGQQPKKRRNPLLALFSLRKSKGIFERDTEARRRQVNAVVIDRHDACLAARSNIPDDHLSVAQEENALVTAINHVPSTICPVARQVLAKAHQARHYQNANLARPLGFVPTAHVSKHGVPRLPRGSLTYDKLPMLDHALASVALCRSISEERDDAVDDGDDGDDTEEQVEQLLIPDVAPSEGRETGSIVATVPVLAKGSSSSAATVSAANDAASLSASSAYSSSREDDVNSREGSISTWATSDRTEVSHSICLAKGDLAATLTQHNSAKVAIQAYKIRGIGKLSFGKSVSARGAQGHDDKEALISRSLTVPALAPTTQHRPSSAGLSASRSLPLTKPRFLARLSVRSTASGDETGEVSNRNSACLTAPRRSHGEAKRLSLLALNALGGHVPQMEYYSQVAAS